MNWRPARMDDIEAIAGISAVALAGYPEEEAIFVELLTLAPEGGHVLDGEGGPVGYLLSHPWMRGMPPALDTRIGALPGRPDSYYIHDLSLLPQARGRGAARAGVTIALDCARAAGLSNVSLVAVNGAAGFWRAQGFVPCSPPGVAASLSSYGADALYMELPLE